MAVLVIVFFTFGWPLLSYLTLKHLFDQHAVTVRLADLPPDEASAIILSNRPTQAEERCATPKTIVLKKPNLVDSCDGLDFATRLNSLVRTCTAARNPKARS
jgi:hypothetical protein